MSHCRSNLFMIYLCKIMDFLCGVGREKQKAWEKNVPNAIGWRVTVPFSSLFASFTISISICISHIILSLATPSSSCSIYPSTEYSMNSESVLPKSLNSVCRLTDLTFSTGQSSISPWCMCLAMWSSPWVPYQYWGDKCYTRE